MTRAFRFASLVALVVTKAALWADPEVLAWNVRNYLLQNRYEHGAFRFDYPKPESQKAALREVLLQSDADIVLLQEIGSPAFLLELQLDLAALGLNYPHFLCSVTPDARTGLALLSRFPPAEVIFHDPVPLEAETSNALQRGIQEIRFGNGPGRLRIFHVHLKSRFSEDPADPDARLPRKAEIAALENFLTRQLAHAPQERLLLAGDFNTPFDDPLLASLRRSWKPVEARDSLGQPWTYHHFRTGSHEVIDGFWMPRRQPLPTLSARIPDTPVPTASDHRPVLLHLP